MNFPGYLCSSIALFVANILYATTVTIEDFDGYTDTVSLQADVTTFGSATRTGLPTLAQGVGVNNTNAVHLILNWEYGNNTNLSLTNLNQAARSLSAVSSIQSSIYLETASESSAVTNPTLVKLAIEGIDGTIWQTKTRFAVQPVLGTFYEMAFNVSSVDMESVSTENGSFEDTMVDIQSIRFRFENSVQAGVFEDAYIDSIVSVTNLPDEPSKGTIIQLGTIDIPIF
ncbi:MAG: hypothetical protein ACI9MF_001228 [Gammaproteobacteria bacterium]|jgi:hypothetical protein